ncbi:MAG TPA: ATP-binding protein [Terriglobia bacterium]|nr:ATP-binding protein [Terriglobia bacterium]
MDDPVRFNAYRVPLSRIRGVGRLGFRLLATLALIAAVTLLAYRLLDVNATTAGFFYLVAILVIATTWGLAEASTASVGAMLCFNYFFLPPIGTFTIADPQNWVALFAFLATSITASHLSLQAKKRAREAVDRQLEMERLYALSRAILLTEMTQPVAKQIAYQIAHTFGFSGVALYDRASGEIQRAGPEDLPEFDDKLREVALQGTQLQDDSRQVVVTAIRLGGVPIGSIVLRGSSLSDTALQAVSNLVAIGLEKVRGQELANRAEAARQSEDLKSTLLDAIAHEFKTPLTSIKAAASAMLAITDPLPLEQRELVTIIDEEADRLARLVTEAIQMARIEGGKFQLSPAPHSPGSLIAEVLEQLKPMTDGREIRLEISTGLPSISVDAELIRLAIRQLLDNALKYSPSTAPIIISARGAAGGVVISVTDHGPGVPEAEQLKIFERFYRSSTDRHHVVGTGMGLTIAREIMRAHGGEVSVASRPGHGAEFSLLFPAGPKEKIA